MSRRTFIFCDICNPMGIRYVEMRRGAAGRDPRVGRRITDGRCWFEGDDAEARQVGWVTVEGSGQHICPTCFSHLRSRRDVLMEKLQVSEADLEALLDSKNPL
jgi:hypothetical protein